MNTPVSVPSPALEPDDGDAALDALLGQLGEAIRVLDLDHLDRFPANTVLSVLSKTAALNRGLDTILTAAANQVAGVAAATASQWVRVGARTTPRVRIGHTLPPLFPHVADALRDGAIGADTAEAITRDLAAAAPRADVEHLARSGNTPTVSGASPTVIVRVSADVLDTKERHRADRRHSRRPASTIQQILCDSSSIPAYLHPDGALIALGTENRGFGREQRLGTIARDGPTCVIANPKSPSPTGSSAPPTSTENGAAASRAAQATETAR